VRYRPVHQALKAEPRAIHHVVLLEHGGGENRLERLSTVDGLRALLEESFASAGALEPETLQNLAKALDAGTCHRLHYESLSEAVRQITLIADA
jgi:hypothetical protein